MTGVTLDAYLRGRALRPNPSAPWRVEYRHAEGGYWTLLADPAREAAARDEVLAVGGALGHGDMVRLRASKGDIRGFWVVTAHGLVDAGKVPSKLGRHGWDWETAWEGRQAEADALLRQASAVHDKRRLLAACDCAETALRFVPPGEVRPRDAIETARRWVRREASLAEVRRAAIAAASAAVDTGDDDAAEAASRAAASAADAVASRAPAPVAAGASSSAAAAAAARASEEAADRAPPEANADVIAWVAHRDARQQARRALSSIVRRQVPLSVVLLARAGEPTPPDAAL